jgi:hypothetical protein
MSRIGNIKIWDIVKITADDHIYNGREGIVRQIFKSGLFLIGFHDVKPGDSPEIRIAKKHLMLVRSYDSKLTPFPIWRNEDIAS